MFPKALPLGPFFGGLAEGAMGRLMPGEALVVEGADPDVCEIPTPGDDAASGFLFGELMPSVEATALINTENKQRNITTLRCVSGL